MKVLFIGGTGTISSGVSPLVIERGHELFLLNRGKRAELTPRGARQIVADARDPASVRAALGTQSFDVVVDWLVFTPDQLEADIELFRGRAGQYVFISSASAYQKPPSSFPITESTPLANRFWKYSREKIACELRLQQEMRDTQFPATIVRPSHTYGLTSIPLGYQSGPSAPWSTVDRMRRGKKVIVHGDGTSLWTMTHNTDFARAFVAVLGNQRAMGHAVHITSDEVLTWDQIYQDIAKAAGTEAKIVHVPSDFIAAFDPEAGDSLRGDKAHCAAFDTTKIKSLAPGWAATVTFAEGVRRSVEWFDAHKELQQIDPAFNDRADRILAAYESAGKAAPAAG